jgi:hypothetical protein
VLSSTLAQVDRSFGIRTSADPEKSGRSLQSWSSFSMLQLKEIFYVANIIDYGRWVSGGRWTAGGPPHITAFVRVHRFLKHPKLT